MNQIRRLRQISGLIARQRLSLVMPSIDSLTHKEKWALFDKYMQPLLEFPAGMKQLGFKYAMKTIAKAWRTNRSNLYCNFILKGVDPFEKHPHIVAEDWEEFIQVKESEEALAESEKFKSIRKMNTHDHLMGPASYNGKNHNGRKRTAN